MVILKMLISHIKSTLIWIKRRGKFRLLKPMRRNPLRSQEPHFLVIFSLGNSNLNQTLGNGGRMCRWSLSVVCRGGGGVYIKKEDYFATETSSITNYCRRILIELTFVWLKWNGGFTGGVTLVNVVWLKMAKESETYKFYTFSVKF